MHKLDTETLLKLVNKKSELVAQSEAVRRIQIDRQRLEEAKKGLQWQIDYGILQERMLSEKLLAVQAEHKALLADVADELGVEDISKYDIDPISGEVSPKS